MTEIGARTNSLVMVGDGIENVGRLVVSMTGTMVVNGYAAIDVANKNWRRVAWRLFICFVSNSKGNGVSSRLGQSMVVATRQ